MKIFIGQKVTGEDLNKLKEWSNEIVEVLTKAGNEVYCNLKEDDERSSKEQMFDAFDKINNFDAFLAIIRNEDKSEGMLMEVGYTLAKEKKLIVAVKENVNNTYVLDMANKLIIFKDHEELKQKLHSL